MTYHDVYTIGIALIIGLAAGGTCALLGIWRCKQIVKVFDSKEVR